MLGEMARIIIFADGLATLEAWLAFFGMMTAVMCSDVTTCSSGTEPASMEVLLPAIIFSLHGLSDVVFLNLSHPEL